MARRVATGLAGSKTHLLTAALDTRLGRSLADARVECGRFQAKTVADRPQASGDLRAITQAA